ncbi:MAG: RHS repeat-associated core domain-containing protein, partial [Lentisphaeria bacterium]
LKMETQNGEFYYTHDANKNVTEVISATNELIANYQYSTFGAVVSETFGSENFTNPFQFSSEYYDSELNLVYYNYRHYNPEIGRWETKSRYNQASPA